jgi:hypothetical protein
LRAKSYSRDNRISLLCAAYYLDVGSIISYAQVGILIGLFVLFDHVSWVYIRASEVGFYPYSFLRAKLGFSTQVTFPIYLWVALPGISAYAMYIPSSA